MPFELKIPPPWRSQGWKVKVRDRERVEPPHVTILHKTTAWRLELRGGEFLDLEPDPGRVPHQVIVGSAEHRGLPEQLGSYVSGKSAGVEEARLRGR